MLLLLLLVASPHTFICLAEHVISVDSVNGHNNVSCLQPNGHPCQTLEYVQSKLKSVTDNSVVIDIREPGINLTKPLNFTNFSFLSIRGAESENHSYIHCNTSLSGLSFFNVTGLTLSFIQLISCGAKGNSSTCDPKTNKTLVTTSALYMLSCTNVTITNVVLNGSNGTGISLYDTTGEVRIEHTNIMESFVRSNSSDIVSGGGGMHIEFSYCTPGSCHDCTHSKDHDSYATYTISNCKFVRNAVHANKDLLVNISSSWGTRQSIGSGGGAYMIFRQHTSNIRMSISNSIFRDNYAQLYGGGLKLQFYDYVHDNRVTLVQTHFTNNSVSNDTMGGGLEFAFTFHNGINTYPRNNSVNVVSCVFKENLATHGGGVNIFSSEVPKYDEESAIYFSDCNWTNNTALYGAAVHVMPVIWTSEYHNHYPLVEFSNCDVSPNTIMPIVLEQGGLEIQTNGAGAFYSTTLTVIFSEMTRFWNNDGTALHLSNGIASFKANSLVVFDSNRGINGGAIALIGRSFLYLMENGSSKLFFHNNTARQLGGGIYFQTIAKGIHQLCFIYRDLHTPKSSFNFSGNYANDGRGHHIYVSSFTTCNAYCQSESPYDCIGTFIFTNPHNHSTATLPTQFSLHDTRPVSVFPGIPYRLPLLVKDLEGNDVSNMSYEATFVGKSNISIDSAFEYVSNNTISVLGNHRERATLRLDASSTDY